MFGFRTAGVDGGHRRLAAVQHHGCIPLGDKRIDAREDLQLRADRGVGAQRVDRAVGAAEHQLAVGAAGDRGEVGAALSVDLHPGRRALGDVDPEIAAARRRRRPARWSSPVIAVAAAGSGTARARPFAGITVTTAWSALPGPSTTNDAVAASNITDVGVAGHRAHDSCRWRGHRGRHRGLGGRDRRRRRVGSVRCARRQHSNRAAEPLREICGPGCLTARATG